MILFLDNDAAAGVLTNASSRIHMIFAFLDSFWGCVARLSASCLVEGVSSDANPADAPGGNKPLFKDPGVSLPAVGAAAAPCPGKQN